MKTKTISVITVLLFLSTSALSDVPNKFIPGKQARADEVNENFNYLDDLVTILLDTATPADVVALNKKVDNLNNQVEIFKDEVRIYSGDMFTLRDNFDNWTQNALMEIAAWEDQVVKTGNWMDQRIQTHINTAMSAVDAYIDAHMDAQCKADKAEFIHNGITVNYREEAIGDEITSIVRMNPAVMTLLSLHTSKSITNERFNISFPFAYQLAPNDFDVAIVTSTHRQRRCSHFNIEGYEYGSDTPITYRAFIAPIISNHLKWDEGTKEVTNRNATTIKLNIHVRPEVMLVFTFSGVEEKIVPVANFGTGHDQNLTRGHNADTIMIDTIIDTIDDFVDVLRIDDYTWSTIQNNLK